MRNLSVCHAEKCDCCFREAYNQYCGSMLCYMDICIAPLTEGYSEASQRCMLVKIKVFKLRKDAGDILCNITLRSAGGESFHSAGPNSKGPILR